MSCTQLANKAVDASTTESTNSKASSFLFGCTRIDVPSATNGKAGRAEYHGKSLDSTLKPVSYDDTINGIPNAITKRGVKAHDFEVS